MRQNLINARHDAKLTQKEVAQKLNISTRFYQNIESGVATGKIDRWFWLAELFGKPMDELIKNDQ